ncbi:hypothetical protein OS493_024443 [Desmophyllum pertusum]|uniref:Uncharacterized protein n=1 Tax=Desmophyllum pertusum TaxID=174260 RepID=A0A9W9YA52_9CNID|nr:hypothetical protein OS493_024443 [Desmophyllum pertusum]
MAKRSVANNLRPEDLGFEANIRLDSVRIYDHLTPRLQELLFKARKYQRDNGFTFCWAKNGSVFLRRTDSSRIIKLSCLVLLWYNLYLNELPHILDSQDTDPVALPNGVPLNCLFYADDLVLISTSAAVLNIKTVLTVVASGVTIVSLSEVLSRWSTFDQLVTAFNSCVLPAGTGLVQLTEGCVCLTVRAETLSALTTLWNLYQDGTLETRLYNFFVTDEIRERTGGEEVEVNVTIEEQEYEKACLELINDAQEAASLGDGGRIRRNSDSAVYCSPKEELPLSKLERIETELKDCKERIAVMEKEIEIFSLDLEASSPEEKATFFKQTLEGRKAREAREMDAEEMDESADMPEVSQPPKPKLMDPGKYAFVEKYLEDIQERHSVTTEASDSGLGTHAAASELGMEEISEPNKLRLKDLSEDVIQVLNNLLNADEVTMERFKRFFGRKSRDLAFWDSIDLRIITELFPDTTVGVWKECFETLQLYDLDELLEKVRPRSLRPALSPKQIEQLPKQIEQLRGSSNRPTKYHRNVAVLVVKHLVGKCDVESVNVEKIEAFFKNLNPRNEVTIIASSPGLQVLQGMENKLKFLEEKNKRMGHQLEIELPQQRESAEKAEMQVDKKRSGLLRQLVPSSRYSRLRKIKQAEVTTRRELEESENKVAALKEQMETFRKPEIKKLQKEEVKKAKTAISTAMDKWFHDQDKFTCIAVFIISDDKSSLEAMLEESGVMEKLALFPDHAKLVVTSSEWETIGTVPETLHVMYDLNSSIDEFYSLMIEIFNKRQETLDLVSMMQELRRTQLDRGIHLTMDNLSTLLRFQKTEEKGSV